MNMQTHELAIHQAAHDLQQSRARLFLQLDALIDTFDNDPRSFIGVLIDVLYARAEGARESAPSGEVSPCACSYTSRAAHNLDGTGRLRRLTR
jgi:hypothetical protein